MSQMSRRVRSGSILIIISLGSIGSRVETIIRQGSCVCCWNLYRSQRIDEEELMQSGSRRGLRVRADCIDGGRVETGLVH